MCGSNDKEAKPAAPEAKVVQFAGWALVVPTDVSIVQCSTLTVSKDVKLNTVQRSFWVLILERSPPHLLNKTIVDRFAHSVNHCQAIFIGETATCGCRASNRTVLRGHGWGRLWALTEGVCLLRQEFPAHLRPPCERESFRKWSRTSTRGGRIRKRNPMGCTYIRKLQQASDLTTYIKPAINW